MRARGRGSRLCILSTQGRDAALRKPFGVAVALLLLAGCSSDGLVDSIPSNMGGLPQGAPARPASPQSFPAVHDLPPARSNTTLSDSEQDKLGRELQVLRDRTRSQNPDAEQPDPKKKPTGNSKTDGSLDAQGAGTKRNP